MRLLDVHSLEFVQFVDEYELPPYTILSHTWGDGEVSFQDLPTPAARSMTGFRKIKKCCKLAIQDGFKYVWIDTCCIDKTSSAELSEAINSMYRWYKSATVCYVYMSDVKIEDDPSDPDSPFSKSRWFTRGWTLQELLAPQTVVFHDCNWTEIGTKLSLQMNISRITGIAFEALSRKSTKYFSIAQRMSWAAKRKTTRVEDIAYCLMGIFDVNMPTLYGEGKKAFIRLQQEILKNSDDHSIFAWTTPSPLISRGVADPGKELSHIYDTPAHGMLASSPIYFRNSQEMQRLELTGPTYPFSMTNKGLHIWLPLVPVQDGNQDVEVFMAVLKCKTTDDIRPLNIYLRRKQSGEYYRSYTNVLGVMHRQYNREPVELYIMNAEEEVLLPSVPKFTLVENPSIKQSCTLVELQTWEEKGLSDLQQSFFLSPIGLEFPLHGTGRFMYIIAENKSHPGVCAMVVVAIERGEGDTYPISCAVYSGDAEIKNAMGCGNFSYLDGVVRNVDRVTKQLSSGYSISVAFRESPSLDGPQVIQYRIIISFAPPTFNASPSGRLAKRLVVPPPVQLTIHLKALGNFSPIAYPSEGWSMDGSQFTWSPPEQQDLALLELNHPRTPFAFLVFSIVDSEIAILLVPPSLASEYGSSQRAAILSHIKANTTSGSLPWLRSADFPQEVKTNEGVVVIKLRPKIFVHEQGYQMQLAMDRLVRFVE
ncbi:hypothetical protein GALMADRAFT_806602 [Galerina marginata CBS 339.88]|uniref:Uncharacterized protein n=1 Tax=Galerina marginata (strain CBS 339.88) TaxID=685588 RepID=A0A067SJJ8_GALM3|nr:hypothetical protein GALMADRAFT_806602 [Galerina marginata CBS 339.88]